MNAEAIEGLIHHELPAAARGDTHAYSRIVASCQNTVTSLALAIVRDVQASEDIAQEAFLKAWQNLRRLQNPSSFLPWLRQITRNLALDHLRERQQRAREIAQADDLIAAVADPHPTPMEHLIEGERELAAAELISALPDDSREVLLLFYREGQSSQQVAALLGLSDAAVRKRLSRARAAVRSELLARFGTFARDTAPSAAFTAMVATALTVTSPAATAAIMLSAGAVGGSAGKIGAGAGLSGGMAGGAAGGGLGWLMDATVHLEWIALASLCGLAGVYFGGRYLLAFAGNDDERAAIRSFMRTLSATTLLFCVTMGAAVVLTRGWLGIAAVSVIGMAIINYQYLVPLPRIMAPCFARLERATGKRQPSLTYQLTCGAPAVWLSSAMALGMLLYMLIASGRMG